MLDLLQSLTGYLLFTGEFHFDNDSGFKLFFGEMHEMVLYCH